MMVHVGVAVKLASAAQPLLPLRIQTVEFQDPMVTVIGERWSLVLLGPWAWTRAGAVEVDWRDDVAEHRVWDLCGKDVVGVVPGTAEPAISFRLSDGSSLSALPDATTYEQWTFHHDDLAVVFVGLR